MIFAAAIAAPKMPNTGLGVKAARHHRRDEVGGHALHHFVAGRDAGDEVLARGAGGFRRRRARPG